MDTKAVLFQYMMAMVGLPYVSGGNNPLTGVDCSGLALLYLTAAGQWPHGVDATAQGIHDQLLANGAAKPMSQASGQFGDLAFFGKSPKDVTHVGVMMAWNLMLEAGGGDSTTTTRDAAAARNAFVRVRPHQFRKDYLYIVRPRGA
jgi:cell wall-associated NlpC family hydrolase